MATKRMQRALDKADRLIQRLGELHRALLASELDEAAREKALVAVESLVLIDRGSSETDHRKQLALSGLQSAFEVYLAPAAPRASAYAASAERDALLAEEALRELRAEYPDEAERLPSSEVAAAVREWAESYAQAI